MSLVHALKNWLIAVRPKTLPASISPVLLGAALAFNDGEFSFLILSLTMFCALFLQVSVNFANDLFDARSGVDSDARLGPLRVSQAGLIGETQLLCALCITTILSIGSGLALVYLSSWGLLLLGLASLVAVFFYSAGPWPLASHAMGELTVFLFFGWLAVGGSYYVQVGELSAWAMVFGTIVGLMCAAIMLVNNIRDITTDAAASKNTLAVVLGDYHSRILYRILLLVACFIHLLVSIHFGWWILLSLVVIMPLVIGLYGNISRRKGIELNRQLAQTAGLVCIYCFTVSAFFFFV